MRKWGYEAGVAVLASIMLVGCSAPLPTAQQNSSDFKIHAPLAQTSNIVFVLPIEGMENPGRLVLADAIAASLRDAARPSVISGQANDQGPTIVGRISEIRRRGSIAWVTAEWELRAPYGTTVATVSHEIVVDGLLWDEGGVEAVNLIVAEAEPHIIGMVADHVGPLTVNQEIAMPPEERFAMPEGSSQTLEMVSEASTPPPSLPQAEIPSGPEPSAIPQVAVEKEEDGLLEVLPEGTPLEALPEALPDGSNQLTPSDLAAAPPVVAQQKPMRLMPGAAPRDGLADGGTQELEIGGDSLDEAALPPEGNAQAAMMSDRSDDAQATPISWGRPSFLIRAVTGAPGDGNEVLTSGIKRAMRAHDLTVSEDPRQAGYEVLGQVTIGPPVNGRQHARVVWRVMTLDGVEVGKAMQENTVIAGSLDGEWGRVGDIVSEAAALGIQELFENQPNLARQSSRAPGFTRNPNLQQVPGRAPPPPG